jgi:copper resistance protein C
MHDWRRRTRRVLVALLLACGALVTLGAPGVALAHANLIEAAPAAGAVDALPEQLRLTFSDLLDRGSTAQLLDASGGVVPEATSQIDPTNRARLLLALPPLPAGAYTVAWTSVSAEDGHEQRGTYALLAGGAGAPAAVGPPVRDPTAGVPTGLDVQLTATPDAQGVQQWQATVAGPGATAVHRVTLRFTPPQADLGVEQLVTEWNAATGAYALAQPMALAGNWTVVVIVRRDGVADDVAVPFTWTAA